ncbi:hypothetical protein L484_024420 [Morus notabilis]|uniref:Uncharacterized protein n=1 Tax=Morus notabilis TaxID=981085 RepID=W9RX97_9ROSA|nr:uncharacterized protein LOC21407159 [Morus notabilis]EXC16246.1 hypothetical protein L484_024420 [Morus notabilis]
MANDYCMSLLGAMDHLWFHQIILLSPPFSLIASRGLETPRPALTDAFKSSISSLEDEKDEDQLSTDFSPTTDDSSGSPPRTPQGDEQKLIGAKQRPKRSSFASRRNRSHSSSPSSKRCAGNLRSSGATSTRLEKFMTYRSLGDLELREVKGFMDLGFIFKKEHLSPRMMSLIPGLQRLKVYKSKENGSENLEGDQEEEEEEEERGVIRPYLSEAWLIKRPGSPLLNLRVPRVSAAADMKKHLRFWARIVASEIQ